MRLDCLVRTLGRLPAPRQEPRVRLRLFTIIHDLLVSHVQRLRARGEGVANDVIDERGASVAPAQDERLQWRDLVKGLDSLPEEQRAVIMLVSVEDFSYAEVGQVLGIPIDAVMSRLFRGRERLRLTMDREKPPTRGEAPVTFRAR